jgi:hypothetical protein
MLRPRTSKPGLAPELHCSFQRSIDYSSPREPVQRRKTPPCLSIVQRHDD